MRILFYLPIVTEFWFDNIIENLIRRAVRDGAEVHVMIPPVWSKTGISELQLIWCSDMPEICWHILDGEEHPSYRSSPEAPEDLIAFVRQIDPDYVFCRSADTITPEQFPGKVRYVMEGDYPPLLAEGRPHCDRVMLTGPRIFDHGILPPLTDAQREMLRDHAADLWPRFRARNGVYPGSREAYLRDAGLPTDRKIIAVPLEYDGQDDFLIRTHSIQPRNDMFLDALMERVGEDCMLAFTAHPILREPYSDAWERIVKMDRRRVRIVTGPGVGTAPTRWLIQHCDGIISRDSKTLMNAAFYGKPILRLSHYRTGEWMNAYTDLDEFIGDVRAGRARVADLDDALTWIAFHHANSAFIPDARGTLADLLDRADNWLNPDRWEANLQRHRADFQRVEEILARAA